MSLNHVSWDTKVESNEKFRYYLATLSLKSTLSRDLSIPARGTFRLAL